ncbi:putative glycine cleavage system H protein [Spironucleus salmonicida]|uniref:Glycine cleavage system H protein n=1 Tax=Spironucleus salmonicida TaxID=348837 RepID=K7R5G0_9EUKA|nr:putative glycine cleavage system H protein [Spironucleus salmonicida]KAH0574420.1 putative glycine cleavage system H protein [Spironucleus salmonicida]|eukprot:EST46074.1 Putative glycine cleavage system H protein [Spironucleus salmonicida]
MSQLAQNEHQYETFETPKFTFKIHRNGILVLFMSPSYTQTFGKISSVVFKNFDLQKIVGKNKHNAHFVKINETLVQINGIEVKSPVSFKLLEQNTRLENEPKLLENDCLRTGYLAVFAPKWEKIETLREVLRKMTTGNEEMTDKEKQVLNQMNGQ